MRRHPAEDLNPTERQMLPTLGAADDLDLYVREQPRRLIRVTSEHPLVGVLLKDVTGAWWITPEEDYRGGCWGAMRVHIPDSLACRWRDKPVWLSGFFADEAGFLAEDIGPHAPDT